MAVRKCGHCKGPHDTVAQARLCARRDWDRREGEAHDEDEARAEQEMERRLENFWEEGTEAQRAQRWWEDEQERRFFGP